MSPNPISLALVVILAGLGALAILAGYVVPGAVLIAAAVIVFTALKMAQQWERAVILRAGKFLAVRGPGLFGIVPILDNIAAVIDTRLRTTQFIAERTLTRDTVPVDVDAIIFWIVVDAKRAALEVVSYSEAIAWTAQTSLRERIGAADLATLLSNRKAMDEDLRDTIHAKAGDWGIEVRSVEIRDVKIPVALQDAMSRQAQAERERQARVILGTAEAEIAHSFVEASRTYTDNPVALHLRGMNMLYESVKERGSTIIVPSSAIDSMNLGGVAGITALAQAKKVTAPHEGPETPPGPWSPPTASTPSASLGCSQSRGNRGSLAGYRRRRRGRRFRIAVVRVMSAAIISRSTAAVDSRSSQNATGRSRRAKRLRANWRTDWVRGPSPPARVSGRPTTRPPTLWVSINANSRAMSSRKRRRRIVSSGVAMMQARVGEREADRLGADIEAHQPCTGRHGLAQRRGVG